MYLFYTPDILTSPFLSEEESGHCVRVLRYHSGDEILLTDGQGTTYRAQIINPNPKRCRVEVIESIPQTKHHRGFVHVAFAPTKNIERVEWLVEKCTEIGVDRLTPLLCRFSERKQLRIDRLQKIILSAAKQSLTAYLPVLDDLTDYDAFIHTVDAEQRFIAHCLPSERKLLRDAVSTNASSWCVLIGPEGDFSDREIELALNAGFHPVSLGDARLRTETAAIAACHTINLLNQ